MSAGKISTNQSDTDVRKLLTMTIMATVKENAATVPAIKGVAAAGACDKRQTAKRKTTDTCLPAKARDSPPQSRASNHGTAARPANNKAAIEPYAAQGKASTAGHKTKVKAKPTANALQRKLGGLRCKVSA
jgi:hypothetical protein